jgi:hypothetical protein
MTASLVLFEPTIATAVPITKKLCSIGTLSICFAWIGDLEKK